MTNAIQIPLPSTRTEWLKLRQMGIGGSDVAALLGLSKWRTPLDVYNSKIEEPEETDNASMEWGRRLEPVIRQKYAEAVGMEVTVPPFMFQHPEHKFMIADVDGIRADGRIVEIKTARTQMGWGEECTDEIPDYYKTQVQHYMTVLGAESCDVAVLIGASDFRIYTVESDPELESLLIEAEADFWHKHVEPQLPPPPTTLEEMKVAFPVSRKAAVECSSEIFNHVEALALIQEKMKELKEQEDAHKAVIQGAMGEADTLSHLGQVICTWKSSKPVARFDSAALKAAMPDIYNQYLKTGAPTRRFTLKI